MLADVVKAHDEERKRLHQEEVAKWNRPIERDIIIYYDDLHIIGGIETWIYNLAHYYEFSLVYKKAHPNQIKRLEKMGVECIKNVDQEIKCNKMFFTLVDSDIKVKANKKILVIHGEYKKREEIGEITDFDEAYAVSQHCADLFSAITGIECGVLYNPIVLEDAEKPLILGVFSRLSKEKGKERIIKLIDKLRDKDFLMVVFTDLPFDCEDKRVIMMQPKLDITGWMQKCDYIVQLSDTEAGCYTIQEGLKLGVPCIVTNLPILKEFNIDSKVAKILEFDMSNLDVDDLWNIPKVDWQEPISKEWDLIMKKRVFREKYNKVDEIVKEEEKVVETPKKAEKKKTKKEDK